jgi:hypothetical protein
MGHQADPAPCYKFSFSMQRAVHLTKYKYIVFVTGEDDMTGLNSRRYTIHFVRFVKESSSYEIKNPAHLHILPLMDEWLR